MADKKFRLHNLNLDEISFVDQPANALAKVVLFKAAKCKLGKSFSSCPFVKGGVCKGTDCPCEGEKVIKASEFPGGVQFNVGFTKDGTMGIESVIFDIAKWNKDSAVAWLSKHKMRASMAGETEKSLRYFQASNNEFTKFRVMHIGEQISKALEHDNSLTALQEQVGNALRDKFQTKTATGYSGDDYVWVRDLFGDYVVFDQSGCTYQAPYTIRVDENSGEKVVTIGEKSPVEVVYQPEATTSKKDDVQIPAELLFKLGQLKAKVARESRRLDALVVANKKSS